MPSCDNARGELSNHEVSSSFDTLRTSGSSIIVVLGFSAIVAAQSPHFQSRPDADSRRNQGVGHRDRAGWPRAAARPRHGRARQGRATSSSARAATARRPPKDLKCRWSAARVRSNTAKPLKTIGSYWPYATTLFDYINRAMPFDRPTVMSADDVYAVTGFLLNLNGIIAEQDVMDAKTVPAVRMPNRDGFVPDPRPDVGPRSKSGGRNLEPRPRTVERCHPYYICSRSKVHRGRTVGPD